MSRPFILIAVELDQEFADMPQNVIQKLERALTTEETDAFKDWLELQVEGLCVGRIQLGPEIKED